MASLINRTTKRSSHQKVSKAWYFMVYLCLNLSLIECLWFKNSNKNTISRMDSLTDPVDVILKTSLSIFKKEGGNLAEITQNISEEDKNRIIEKYDSGLCNSDADMHVTQLFTKYGQRVLTYQVETEDGYLLTVFRLKGHRDPVFLMHGLLSSADDFVTPGPESGLVYLLAAEGYDVWLGNARGNVHSRAHKRLSPDSAEFWQFSWDEIGLYDLPAMIDFVLGETGRSQLKYVGHSQGTTSFFVMCSMKPEYNKKISLMVALSAVAFMSNLKSPIIRILSPANPFLSGILELIGMNEFLPRHGLLGAVEKTICGTEDLALIFCNTVNVMLGGFSYGQTNITNLPVLYGHMPAGASVRQLVHYGQGVVSGKFCRYDHGILKNVVTYGSKKPPSYPVQEITAPVAIFYSDEDWLASSADVFTLSSLLPNVVDVYKVPFEPFNHMDFIWAKDFKRLIFYRLLYLFQLYQ